MALLKNLRNRTGFTADEVATAAGWSRVRLAEIEREDDLDEAEAERLGDLYGVDIEALLGGTASVDDLQPVGALLKAQAETLDASSRFAIAEAAGVARSIRQLQRLLGEPTGWNVVERFRANADYSHPIHGAPEALAEQARRELRLGVGPIRSVRESILDPLGVVVLWETLPSYIDAIAMATPETGAVILANLVGEHTGTAFGRRITWAHEICHILFDRPQMREVRKFCAIAYSGPKAKRPRNRAYEIERRARAFAAWLLVPRADLVELWHGQAGQSVDRRVRAVMETFGVGYEATRSQLDSAGLLPMRASASRVSTETPEAWERLDALPESVERLLRGGASPLRVGVLYELAARAHARGLVSESFVREQVRMNGVRWRALGPVESPEPRRWATSAALLGDRA